MSEDDRNTDLTPDEMRRIIDQFWPSRVDRSALHLMLQAAADLALSKYLGIPVSEPAPVEAVIQTVEYPDLDPKDIKIDTFRPPNSGGGFSMNRVDVAVRITHLPTGLKAEAWEDRSQHMNKIKAYEQLKRMVALHVVDSRTVMGDDDPFPEFTDTELAFAYRTMVRSKRNGLDVNFMTGDISLPKKKG